MQKRMPCTGKCWVAIKDDRVVDLTPMYAPADVDFDAHRNACVAELEKSGTVRAGDLIRRDETGNIFCSAPDASEQRRETSHAQGIPYRFVFAEK